MKSLSDTFTLNNGVEIPCVGFGTWQIAEGDEAFESVKVALEAGYRHIDTAAGYGNEESVGRAIRESGIAREDIFVTTKLQNPAHGYEATKAAFEESMSKLGLKYVDLYLIHWPNPAKFRDNWQEANAGTWKAFEEFYEAKRIHALGISNFRPHHIKELEKTANVPPAVNQIRLCPGDTQDETVDYCKKNDILLAAYSPLGTGSIFDVAVMKELATKHDKTVAQVALRWSLQHEFLPLPKSTTPERIKENAALFDFSLDTEDMEKIDALDGVCGYAQDPDQTTF